MVNAPEVQVAEAPKFPPFEYANLLDKATFGDWRDELATQGFYVVKGAIEKQKALEYLDRALTWQESFGLGFKRDDVSTYRNECLPAHHKGGMIHGYGIAHEDWTWEVRCEQGVQDAFAKVWGTEELITSFDAASIMLPKRTDVTDGGKWEHVDQSPHRYGMYCVQGIVNLNKNGPDDGGLMVLKGSSKLFEEYFDENGRHETRSWGPTDWYGFTAEEQKWYYDRGCEWIKVEADSGDLILWDSRTMHYNVRPQGDRVRVCTSLLYADVCMAPAKLLSEDDRAIRKIAFDEYRGTTHVPFASIYQRKHEPKVRVETGKACPLDTGIPKKPRTVTETVLKLAGLQEY